MLATRYEGWNAFGRRPETPNLCLDLDRFEANLQTMARSIAASGKHWRPHSKCHKSSEVARQQIAAGAIGITCAKVSEAEIFANVGIRDLLLAHLPVGATRIDRVTELCKTADVVTTCDHFAQAEPLSAECQRKGVTCRVLVDINIGMNRTGINPGSDALELACAIERLPGLRLAGIMGYEGHVMRMSDPDEKQRVIRESLGILDQSRKQFLQAGLCCDIVSAGGTGSLSYAAVAPGITELQSGGGIFGDPFYTKMPGVSGYEPALTVLCTVVSRPALDRAVLDAGRKAITAESHPPLVKDYTDARVTMHSAEHIVLELGPESRNLKIGDQIELIVGYADFTTLLHEEFLCFRGNRLEAIWPVVGRGRLQ
jgi:D-serine deaminase-like pyridoxal phosphate-dependent protein